jgi:uncharacterized protein YcbX
VPPSDKGARIDASREHAAVPTLSRITIFPIKSLDGCALTQARVLAGGALEHDRRWAIVDAQGRVVNGKRTASVHPIRARFDEQVTEVALSGRQGPATFRLPDEAQEIAAWLSAELGLKCRLIENPNGGFPDDGNAPGPTLISEASLAAAASWFDGLNVAEMRRRIRANLEIDAPAPFWEDRLADDGLSSPRFALGSVEYCGRTICERCVVPTRDSQTGDGCAGFQREFADRRRESLPAWSPAEQFNHYYRLAINTAPAWVPDDAILRVGDALTVR